MKFRTKIFIFSTLVLCWRGSSETTRANPALANRNLLDLSSHQVGWNQVFGPCRTQMKLRNAFSHSTWLAKCILKAIQDSHGDATARNIIRTRNPGVGTRSSQYETWLTILVNGIMLHCLLMIAVGLSHQYHAIDAKYHHYRAKYAGKWFLRSQNACGVPQKMIRRPDWAVPRI